MNEPIKPSPLRSRSVSRQTAPLLAAVLTALILTASLLRFQEYNWAETEALGEMTDHMLTMLTAPHLHIRQEKSNSVGLPAPQNPHATPALAAQ